MFLWTNGASRQIIEALAKCGLCVSFSSLTTVLKTLAMQGLEWATEIAHGPHILCYDNINISTSTFGEQRSSAPTRVQSGTFPIIYEVRNGNSEYMRLAPILQHAYQASDLRLTFNADVRPNLDQIKSTQDQFKIHIIEILLEYSIHFKVCRRHGLSGEIVTDTDPGSRSMGISIASCQRRCQQ
jgi:hypothetical protein